VAQLRLALAQANPVVGDLSGNSDQVVAYARRAAAAGAHLMAFPEMFLTSYPVEDLALRPSFVDASVEALADLAPRLVSEGLGELVVVLGYLDRRAGGADRLGLPLGSPQNAAAVLHGGRVLAKYAKHHLPNYGVFDEFRYFVPGDQPCVVRVHGIDVALAICEDLWQDGGPVAETRAAGAGLLLVLNGSPYELDKHDVRLELCQRRAAEAGCTLAYLNMLGGQDELVFDGDSLVVGVDGTVLERAGQFTEELVVVDLELPPGRPDAVVRAEVGTGPLPPFAANPGRQAQRLSDEAEVYAALTLAVRDYVRKNGFASVLVALSGGIDSALVAAIACDAVGAENVHCVSMPSDYSSQHSRDDAADLAKRTGCGFRTLEIAPMVDAYQRQLGLSGLAEENLQARVRGTALMGISNQEGHLVLATGNKSELAVGYSTIYGDAVGGFAPIKDVPKTLVWGLARWRNADARSRGEVAPIPVSSIDKPPSAELRPGQLDSDSLPDYAELDELLDRYVEQDHGAAQLVADGLDAEFVERILRMIDAAEYKRRQYPPGPKISFKAFGRDRRLPITNRWRERAPRPLGGASSGRP
jgi:NAD+ synthase (glutamine-hydrolysing)